ncbi:ABC transporter ATP-binding protein [Ectobacillus antri]|uniref:ABC transporter ATP-binding protein n=1 Tax=Ectobacillus antri TaxID=2486280 RepID=UPI000F5A9462|nr:ABC transporter ATP-binding protein [Ectobacillus antri]
MKELRYYMRELHMFSGKVLYINMIAMVLISLLEGAGILLLVPMIQASGIIGEMAGASWLQNFFAFINKVPETWALPVVLLIYVILILFQTIIQQKLNVRNMQILIKFTNYIRLRIYRSLLEVEWSFFVKKRKSDLINMLTSEFGRFVNGINLCLQLLTSFLFTCIQICIAFCLSPSITLFVLVSGLLLSYFSRRFIKRSQSLGSRSTDIAKDYLSGITDHFNGVKDIKSNALERSRYTWLQTWCETVQKEQLAYAKLSNSSQLFYKVVSAILVALLIYASIQMFQSKPAQLLLIVLIFSRLWPRFTGLQSNLEQVGATIPVFQSFFQLQQQCEKWRELNLANQEKIVPLQIQEGLTCKNLSFQYKNEENAYALRNINLHIPVNSMTAIAGRSGAGKSTLIDLIMGLMQPDTGNVYLDQKPLTQTELPALRKEMSYVAQDPFLFNASIRDNLLVVRPAATEKEIWEALEFASAIFVKQLPQGLDTVIGDRGVRLSGGERQRLVLARAILRKPTILVLDEATSALDMENERHIQQALNRLKGQMTIIVIAHRLSTISNADQVIVIDKGEVVQTGTFADLAKDSKGLFHKLLGNQVTFLAEKTVSEAVQYY